MGVLDGQRWSSKIFSGEWIDTDDGVIPVIEPVADDQIGTFVAAAASACVSPFAS